MPVRNRYFHGKLLDVRHLEMEQAYLVEHRRRLNRLTVGFGVVCGLELTLGADGRAICVAPGFALDAHGREIVVSETVCVEDPSLLTDACGHPAGTATGTEVTLCLAYHECDTDPAPVLVDDCDVREGCVAGAVRERFKVLVGDGPPDGPPYPQLPLTCRLLAARLDALGAARGAGERVAALAAAPRPSHGGGAGRPPAFPTCAEPAQDCVVLGTVTLATDAAEAVVDDFTHRRIVLSNDHLQEAVLCLAAAVERCCARHEEQLTIEVTSGDGQSEKAEGTLAEPVVVHVEDADGAPVEGQAVTFAITSSLGGDLDPAQGVTDVNGDLKTTWRLGKPGPQTAAASLPGGTPSVSFTATAEG